MVGTEKLVHWYDVAVRRVACGSQGQSGSTKHGKAVTCGACIALWRNSLGAVRVDPEAARFVH